MKAIHGPRTTGIRQPDRAHRRRGTGAFLWAAALWAAAVPIALFLTPGGAADASPNPQPANVLLIVMDDIGVDQVGVYEDGYDLADHPDPCTPQLDSFAQGAMRFTNAWSNPVCSPTRSLIMTGMPAFRTGMGSVTGPNHPESVGLDEDMFTIADLVRSLPSGPNGQGVSAAIGKWHLADDSQWPYHPVPDPTANPFDPDAGLGFTYFQGSYFNINNYYDWSYTQMLGGTATEDPNHSTYATTQTTTDATAMFSTLEQESGDQPWLLYVAFNASHKPYHCPATGDCPDACSSETNWCEICGDLINPWLASIRRTRAMTQTMDAAIGQLIAQAPENTAIIIIGDNGTPRDASYGAFDPFPNDPSANHAKGSVYQGGVNVPLIIRSPWVNSGLSGRCDQLVSATDLFATVAQFLQVAPPENPFQDSRPLARYVDNSYCFPCLAIDREYVYAERFEPTFRPTAEGDVPSGYVASTHQRALRNTTHKLIEKRTAGGVVREFYRLYDDVVGDAAPQDPAVLDDPDGGNFNLSSAFETMDLMDYPNDWTTEDTEAFDALTCELADHYPALPVAGLLTATAAFTTTRSNMASEEGCTPTQCSDGELTVQVDHPSPMSKVIDRAVLQFDLRSLVLDPGESITSVTLEVGILQGAGSPSTSIVVKPYAPGCGGSCDPLGDACDCTDAYDGITGASYATASGWDQVGVKSIILGGSIADDLEAAIATGTFSLGLKIQGENTAPDDGVSLYALGCGAKLYHQLRIGTVGGGNGGGLRGPVPEDPELVSVAPRNYPNPFGPQTTIHYSVATPSPVSIRIYNAAGQLVRTLIKDEIQQPRDYDVIWNGTDDAGRRVATGLYFYDLQLGAKSISRPMMLMR
ncbi:MAG: sulfatase-like hydrolase/transferase [Candidatus Eisenbacteria bacterium]|uniref:Sulfatase-like hydrolase/transferase n=1 Tax=Eiseniibacteriota bacterium TaxID=2212470 RepID=A0A956RN93_UNCEI|nr:sulfatase-like hydrolase/transferase [Candidatus Eisenbacteria bacterium]